MATTKKTGTKGKPGGKKKVSAYNMYMKNALAKLKEEKPDITHMERFKLATERWKTSPDNPKKA